MNLQLVSGFLFACQPIGLLNYSVGPECSNVPKKKLPTIVDDLYKLELRGT